MRTEIFQQKLNMSLPNTFLWY